DYSTGAMVVGKVASDGPAARAGLRVGDRILSVDAIPVRREKRGFDFFYRAAANFESLRPIRVSVVRQGRPTDITIILEPNSLKRLGWRGWNELLITVFTFALALLLAFRRPHDSLVWISTWLLATMAIDMTFLCDGWAGILRHQPAAIGVFF